MQCYLHNDLEFEIKIQKITVTVLDRALGCLSLCVHTLAVHPHIKHHWFLPILFFMHSEIPFSMTEILIFLHD